MKWTVRVSDAARNDFDDTIEWTLERFGEHQAIHYVGVLTAALNELFSGPHQPGVKSRDDIGKGLFTLHVARRGRKGRHFLIFRVADSQEQVIEIVRLLHDAMDLPRHLSAQ